LKKINVSEIEEKLDHRIFGLASLEARVNALEDVAKNLAIGLHYVFEILSENGYISYPSEEDK